MTKYLSLLNTVFIYYVQKTFLRDCILHVDTSVTYPNIVEYQYLYRCRSQVVQIAFQLDS